MLEVVAWCVHALGGLTHSGVRLHGSEVVVTLQRNECRRMNNKGECALVWPRVAPCTGCSEQGVGVVVGVGVTSTSPLGHTVCLVIPGAALFHRTPLGMLSPCVVLSG